MRTILVTGSTGLSDSEAGTHFDRQSHRVIGVDNNMHRVFFGAQGDTTWNLEILNAQRRNLSRPALTCAPRLTGNFASFLKSFESSCRWQGQHTKSTCGGDWFR